MKPAIRVRDISKLYRIGTSSEPSYRTFREALVSVVSRPACLLRKLTSGEGMDSLSGFGRSGDFWALRDVSFEVEPGEVVGVIGRNGAGKSTLLKILSRVTAPSRGCVELRGRVGSLLEVGTGFHPELTGRDNIYLNGAILGMSRREIRSKFDEIVAFAEIERFLDTPVKRYSSGMYVRLAFAVAAHLETEILLVDEVLAVGDQAFQAKCMRKIGDIMRDGRTILLVSHNMASIQNLCTKVLFLESGRFNYFGETREGVQRYARGGEDAHDGVVDLADQATRRPGGHAIFRRVRLVDKEGATARQFLAGDTFGIEFDVHPSPRHRNLHFRIAFQDVHGTVLFHVATYLAESGTIALTAPATVTCRIPEPALAPGAYTFELHAGSEHEPGLDVVSQPLGFEVLASDFFGTGRMPPRNVGGSYLVRSLWKKRDAADSPPRAEESKGRALLELKTQFGEFA
jgi:lipopolysaccharide transport system ATP-binding protein